MTFSRMNNKSSNIHSACVVSTAANLSDNKFLKDYYKLAKPYLDRGLSAEIPRSPSVEELRTQAEQEFINSYGIFPTCAVYAPGSLTIAGKCTNLAESKSLSMAVQLVTLIIGKRSQGGNRCQVRTLSDKITGEKALELCLDDENLRATAEETPWIRYLKGAIQTFKARRARVPAFQIVIASSLPVKRGLGSSSALVVAFYTFLEAITNTCTENIMEKTLACHLAEKLARDSCDVRIADILVSVLGVEDKFLALNTRTLNIEQYDWNSINVELVLIELSNPEKSESHEWRNDEKYCKEIMTILNTKSRWRSHQTEASMMNLLFSQEILEMTRNVIDENERIDKMSKAIREEQWEEFGKLLWENHRSTCKYLSFLPEDAEHVMSLLETIEGVLGACVTGYGAAIIALVQRSKLKDFVCFMNRMKISQRYYLMQSCKGASTIYSYEQHSHPWHVKHSTRPRLVIKYLLRGKDKHRISPLYEI